MGRHKTSQDKLVAPKYLVLHQSNPIQIANRYSSVGATVGMVKPTYQSALVTPIDPLLTQSNQKTPSYSHLKTPQILAKAY